MCCIGVYGFGVMMVAVCMKSVGLLLVYASRWKKWHVSGLFWDICMNYNGWLSCNLVFLMGNVMVCG